MTKTPKVTTFLAFRKGGAEAVRFYVSLVPGSKIHSFTIADGRGPARQRKLLGASFELGGQPFLAIDGGAPFRFDMGMSLFVRCENQKEVDRLWEKLSKGGQKSQCGWLKDRWGIWWQIVPAEFEKMMNDPEHGNIEKMMAAMFTMGKLDIAELRRAYRSS